MLANLKLLLGIALTDTTKDTLLTLILAQCQSYALDYTHITTATTLEPVILQMAVYRYNRIGTEGLTSENYNGSSYSYENDYPDYIVRQLQCNRKVRTVQ